MSTSGSPADPQPAHLSGTNGHDPSPDAAPGDVPVGAAPRDAARGDGPPGVPTDAAASDVAPTEGVAADAADIENVGTTMVQELTQLLGSWEAQALTLAERGVDPRPLLAALAQNLRTVADSLDGGVARSEAPEG
ncbi:MAG TPA: hypothetical protein VK360_06685 [Acidimicrobiales bacterium]|nr:hypothetical protein [Acidimicrobiales bacterium]